TDLDVVLEESEAGEEVVPVVHVGIHFVSAHGSGSDGDVVAFEGAGGGHVVGDVEEVFEGDDHEEREADGLASDVEGHGEKEWNEELEEGSAEYLHEVSEVGEERVSGFVDDGVAGIEEEEVSALLAGGVPEEPCVERERGNGGDARDRDPVGCPNVGDVLTEIG